MHIALIATAFNRCTSNLSIIFNRMENAKNMSLRMVKLAKKKGKCSEIDKKQNANSDVSAWTLQKYDIF